MDENTTDSFPLANQYISSKRTSNNPRILFYLNPSNGTHVECDSGIVFNKLLIDQLILQDCQIHIASQTDPHIPGTQFNSVNQGDNKYSVRFGYDCSRMNEIVNSLDNVNICFLNQTEHGANIKSTCVQAGREDISLVSYYHYLSIFEVKGDQFIYDSSLNQGNLAKYILRRQLETAELSDRVLIHSKFGKKLLMESAEQLGCNDFSDKIRLVPAPVDLSLHSKKLPESKNRKLKILFNNRLYDHYGIHTIVSYLDTFSKEYTHDFELVLTNPTAGRSQERNTLDSSVQKNLESLKKRPYIRIDHRPLYSEYHNLLDEITIGVAPYRPALWSMSSLDVMASWKPVIAPCIGAFPEIVPQGLLYSDRESFCEVMANLVFDESFYQRMQILCRKKAEEVRLETIGDKFYQIFREVMNQ